MSSGKMCPKPHEGAEIAENEVNPLFDHIDGFEVFLILLVQFLSNLPLLQEGKILPVKVNKVQGNHELVVYNL